MSQLKVSEPLFVEWFTDEGTGNKISIPVSNEQKKVINNKIIMDYVPDYFYKVTFASTPNSELNINEQITSVNQYKVDYNIGCIYLHPDRELENLTFDYYKRGIVYYPASRVYTEKTNDSITQTVEDVLDLATDALVVLEDLVQFEADAKVELNSHTDIKKGELDSYTTTKEGELDSYTTVKEGELDTHTTTKESQLDSYTTAKEGDLDTYTNTKETQLDNYTASKEDELDAYALLKEDDIDDYVAQWGEFDHKGNYSGAVAYKTFNIVRYSGSTFMAILDTTAGISPANTSYWRVVATDGSNFTPRGIYNPETHYSLNDIVTYQNGIYFAKGSTTGNVPTNVTYWDVYLKLDALEILYQDVIADSTVETTYTGDDLTSVVWKDANTTATIRTDTYTYDSDVSSETITELRTLAGSGETLEIVSIFDLNGNFISGTSTSNV